MGRVCYLEWGKTMRLAVAERVGTMLSLVRSDGSAEIVRSMQIVGDFPPDKGIKVMFDFAKQPGKEGLIVQLTRELNNTPPRRGEWELSAIQNRDAAGLAGFTDFAKSVGITGAQLANLVEGLKPEIKSS